MVDDMVKLAFRKKLPADFQPSLEQITQNIVILLNSNFSLVPSVLFSLQQLSSYQMEGQ